MPAMTLGGKNLSVKFSMRGMDRIMQAVDPIRFKKALNASFEDAAKVIAQRLKETFDAGVRPQLQRPSAQAANKSPSKTLVTTGAARDAVAVRSRRDTNGFAVFSVGLPPGPLADRFRMHEFGPTNLPLTPARRNFLRAIGFNIPDSKQFVVMPRRPVFQITLKDPGVVREAELAMIQRVRSLLAGVS